MNSDADLSAVMARYQQGDTASATELVRRLSPQLIRFFRLQFVSRRHADDLLQETWLRIHEVRHTYRPGQPVLPWLYAIARHVRVDHYRKALRTEQREAQLTESANFAHSTFPRQGHTPGLEEMLAVLPESQREIVAMLKLADMSLEDVACATSSSVGSVKQKAHRAYKRLRKSLTELTNPTTRGKGVS